MNRVFDRKVCRLAELFKVTAFGWLVLQRNGVLDVCPFAHNLVLSLVLNTVFSIRGFTWRLQR